MKNDSAYQARQQQIRLIKRKKTWIIYCCYAGAAGNAFFACALAEARRHGQAEYHRFAVIYGFVLILCLVAAFPFSKWVKKENALLKRLEQDAGTENDTKGGGAR